MSLRLWMCDPRILCRQHLLAEHNEIHKFIGTLRSGISYTGYITGGKLEVHSLHSRHEELVEEMVARGYNHKSPFPEDFVEWEEGSIPREEVLRELLDRCPECTSRAQSLVARS